MLQSPETDKKKFDPGAARGCHITGTDRKYQHRRPYPKFGPKYVQIVRIGIRKFWTFWKRHLRVFSGVLLPRASPVRVPLPGASPGRVPLLRAYLVRVPLPRAYLVRVPLPRGYLVRVPLPCHFCFTPTS